VARPLRIEYDGALYHVTSRGNDRKAIFKDDSDRTLFLNTLAQLTNHFHWICCAYCLMNNHYHLVIETLDGNLSKGMTATKSGAPFSPGQSKREHQSGPSSFLKHGNFLCSWEKRAGPVFEVRQTDLT
jgi:putative transposase